MLNAFTSKLKNAGWLFHVTVTLPTLAAILYFGLIASDVYVSESRFLVRSVDKPSFSGLGMLLQGSSIGGGGAQEATAVQEFIKSRDATRALDAKGAMRTAFSSPEIDPFNRFDLFGQDESFESFYRYFNGVVSVQHDSTSASTHLIARAYTPETAHAINERLLQLSEALVNRLNERSRGDLIRSAQREVDAAEARARNAAVALSIYRNAKGIVDPTQQAELQSQLIAKLQDELIATRTQLSQLRAFTPENPQIPVLQERTAGLEREIQQETAKIAGGRGSLAGAAVQYQRLFLENQFAERQLASAMASLEQARNEARRKQVYLQQIAQPNLPDEAIEPRRLRGIAATFLLGLVAWGILTMLLAGMREHQD